MIQFRNPLARAGATLCLALATLVATAAAQAPSWSSGFAAPALPGGASAPLVSFDDGSGPRLYSTHSASTAAARWTGTAWEIVFQPGTPGYFVMELSVMPQGGVPVLVVAYARLTFPHETQVWRYDGASWVQLGVLPYRVLHLSEVDDGSGPALFASGYVSDSGPGRVSLWNGSIWSQVGPDLLEPVSTLAGYDDGSGPQLHAGGWGPAIATGSTVARWNGTSWSAVGTTDDGVNELAVLNGQLFLAAQVPGTSGGIQRWNGSAWTFVGSSFNSIMDLEPIDFGTGPELVLAGGPSASWGALGRMKTPGGVPSITAIPGVGGGCYRSAAHPQGGAPGLAVTGDFNQVGGVVTKGFALWNGALWSTLGRGFDAPVRALAVHDHGAGPMLHAVGPGISGYGVAFQGTQRWNGTDWSALGSGFGGFGGSSAYVLKSLDLGSGAQLYGGGHNTLGNPNRGVARWNGTAWVSFAPLVGGDVHCLTTYDPGTGVRLIAGGNFLQSSAGAGNRITQFNGTSWSPLGSGMNNLVAAVANFDEGSGPQLFAGGSFTTAGGTATGSSARWNGTSWSALGSGTSGGSVQALCVFDDGGGARLYAGGTFTNAGGVPVQFLARWNGTSWSNVPGGGANGAILALHVHDDGRGPALYVGGGFGTIGGITAYNIARFDGSTWEAVDGGFDNVVRAFASVDDDGDGDQELFVGGDFQQAGNVASGRIARLEGRPHYMSFCFGDGTLADHTTPCPCANDGAPGHGCANAFDPNGARLQASGNVNPDTFVLAGSGMPLTAFGIYLQHDALDDRVFHDGVICAGGNLIRLRNRNAVGGSSTYPNSTDTQTVSQRGQVTPGSGATRYYSLFYRAASPTFCPPATANVTNGVRVTW